MSIGTVGLRESEEIGADEICDAVYIIEKRSREALLLHLGRRHFCVHHMDILNACAHSRRRPFPMCFSIDISCRKSLLSASPGLYKVTGFKLTKSVPERLARRDDWSSFCLFNDMCKDYSD